MSVKQVVGITGGIACGKSTVSNYLREKGYCVIDADKIAREITAPGKKGLHQILAAFGSRYLTEGSLNRKALGDAIFADEKKRELLNQITWPLITEEILLQIQQADGTIFLEAALLYESGMDKLCDRVWLVNTKESLQKERLKKRNGYTDEEAEMRIRAQGDWLEKRAKADHCIENNGEPKQTYEKIDELLKNFKN